MVNRKPSKNNSKYSNGFIKWSSTFSCVAFAIILALHAMNHAGSRIGITSLKSNAPSGEQEKSAEFLGVKQTGVPANQGSVILEEFESSNQRSFDRSGQGCKPVYYDPTSIDVKRSSSGAGKDNGRCTGNSPIQINGSTFRVTMDNPSSACYFSEIYWAGDYAIVNGARKWTSKEYVPEKSDFVQVQCVDFNSGLMKELAVPVPSMMSPARLKLRGWHWLPKYAAEVNVFVLGIQGTPSNDFIRNFPRTHDYLKDRLHAVHFPGYNVLGRGPLANFLPILTGERTPEIWESQGLLKLYTDEVYRIVLRQFERYGYVTALVDDLPFGSPFRGHERGFRKRPADHYTRPLQMMRKFMRSDKDCVGSQSFAEVIMDYTHKLWNLYESYPRFFMTMFRATDSADDQLSHFLGRTFSHSILDNTNTILVVVSDDGRGFDSPHTAQSREEENSPVLYIRLPIALKENWPDAYKNFLENSNHLVTALDIHATLSSLLQFKTLNYTSGMPSEPLPSPAFSGRNLFQSQAFEKGNCNSLGIREEFCSCHEHEVIESPEKEPWLAEYGRRLVDMINGVVQDEMKVFEKASLRSDMVQYLDMCKPWAYSRVTLASRFGEAAHAKIRLFLEVKPRPHSFEVNVFEEDLRRTIMPHPFEVMPRHDVKDVGCCVPRELHLLRELCLCNLEVTSVKKACDAIRAD